MNAEQFDALFAAIDARLNTEAEARMGSVLLGQARVAERQAKERARQLLVDDGAAVDIQFAIPVTEDEETFPLFPA